MALANASSRRVGCRTERETKGKSHSNPNPTWDPEYDEKMAMASRADGNYTDDASLKQPHTLTMDDSDEIGGVRVYRSESE